MRNLASALALVGATSGTAALADIDHFRYAFQEACLQSVTDLNLAPPMFEANGWKLYVVGDAGEYEVYAHGTDVYLTTQGENAGCTVMDEEVSLDEATEILEYGLQIFKRLNQSAEWAKHQQDDGKPFWVLADSDLTVEFDINRGLGGGAAITLLIQQ